MHTLPAGGQPAPGTRSRPAGSTRWELIGPLFLCLGIALLARLYGWQQDRLAAMSAENHWRQEARAEIERFRGGWTYALQVESAMDRLRRSVGAMLKARSEVSGETFARLFRSAVPVSHRPEGTLVFAFRVDPAGNHETMRGPGLESAMGRLVGNVLVAALSPDAVSSARRPSLDRQASGLFGELVSLDVLARLRRGRLTGSRWRGGDYLMVWNAAETAHGTVLWLALFPRKAATASKPVELALKKGAARCRGRMWPVLVPLIPESGQVRTRVASGTVPPAALRRLHTAIAECGSRNRIASAGSIGKTISGLWVMRDIISTTLPYELWMIGFVPAQARGEALPPWERGLYAALFGGFLLFAARRAMNPGQSDLSLRVWFAGYVALAGVVPLGIVWVLASWWITANAERRAGEMERMAEDRLVRLDLMSIREVDRFAETCGKAIENPSLLKRLVGAPAGAAGQAAVDRELAGLRAAGLPAEYMHVFRPGRDSFMSTAPGANDRPNRGLFQLQSGMLNMTFIFGDPKHTEEYTKSIQGRARLSFEAFKAVFTDVFGRYYYDVRRRGHLFRGSDEPLFMTYDLISSPDRFLLGVVFATRAREHFASLLGDEIARWRVMLPGVRVAWGRMMPGGFEPSGDTARILSPDLTRTLNDAARAGTMRISRSGERISIARPCDRMPGFIAGMEFSTAGIRREAARNILLLENILSIIVSILFLIGLGVGRHLLQPLSRLEAGLRRAASGDLDTRVGLERPDEIGEVTNAFDRMIDGLRERRELGRFVSATLDQDVAQERETAVGPREVEGAVLVSDLRSFTTISETKPVDDVVGMLNAHLEAMAGAIHAAGGKIDRFIGDAVIAAFYGESPAENARRALSAAVAMRRAHERRLAERRAGGAFEYGMGVGIDAGKLLVGSFGTSERMERAVLGPPREFAECLEADSKKGRHTTIVLSPEMIRLLGGSTAGFEKVPGSNGWELVELPPEAGA
ncbi:MAG: Adenylate cyclase 1 [bacterium ADurb.Bin374]|nr:MAG: Adenylate cyclase 1 [bacterium ADurb.Bin374]